jgi:hypothetical protein
METLERLKEKLRIGGTTLIAVAAISIEHDLYEVLVRPQHRAISVAVALLAAFCAAILLEFLVDRLDRVRWFRRLVLGKNWMEGTWLDFVVDKETKKPLSCGIIRIGFEDGELSVNGENFDLQGNSVGVFEDETVFCRRGRVQFIYRYVGVHSHGTEVGYAEYNFAESDDGPPIRYTGFFFDTDNLRRLCSSARKVIKKEDIEALKQQGSELQMVVKRIIDDHQPSSYHDDKGGDSGAGKLGSVCKS